MELLLDAVRAANGGKPLDEATEKLVRTIDDIFAARDKNMRESNDAAMVEAIRKAIGGDVKNATGEVVTIIEQLREMAQKMDKIESASQRRMTKQEKFMLRSMLEKSKKEIMDAVRSESPKHISIEFNAMRAPAMMTTQNVITGVTVETGMNIEFDGEVVMIRYPQNFILDMINSRQVSKVPAHIYRRAQKAREGQAVVVPEGGLKPLVSYSFEDQKFDRIKYAARMEWTEELEYDFEQLLNRIIDLFEVDVIRDWQDGILTQILTAATAYTSSRLDSNIPSPDVYTAIGAAILQIQNMDFNPDVIWMNPGDVWLMNLTQDTNGNYKLPPIMVGNNTIAGLRLYTSNAIEPGKFLVGESRTWKEQHGSFVTRIGLVNEQFIHNEKTIIGEIFSIAYQMTQEQASWLYGEIDVINALLQKP